MSRTDFSDLARRLAEEAEAVCRAYLSNGRRQGNYWRVGDVYNAAGASLHVRLTGPTSGPRARGRWADEATGEFGNLLDLIRLNRGHDSWSETLKEARSFLRMPRPQAERSATPSPAASSYDPNESARRLFRFGRPLRGTSAATYLAGRGLDHPFNSSALRFHPRCNYLHDDGTWAQHPALLAALTDLSGAIVAIQRTWLAPDGRGKADLDEPRRILGQSFGDAVRFGGSIPDILLAGEGLETVLSVQAVLPALPAHAALTANRLSALLLPPGLRRLYVVRDNDAAGLRAYEGLRARAEADGVQVWELVPGGDDFNTDLQQLGPAGLALHLASQLAEEDTMRFLRLEAV